MSLVPKPRAGTPEHSREAERPIIGAEENISLSCEDVDIFGGGKTEIGSIHDDHSQHLSTGAVYNAPVTIQHITNLVAPAPAPAPNVTNITTNSTVNNDFSGSSGDIKLTQDSSIKTSIGTPEAEKRATGFKGIVVDALKRLWEDPESKDQIIDFTGKWGKKLILSGAAGISLITGIGHGVNVMGGNVPRPEKAPVAIMQMQIAVPTIADLKPGATYTFDGKSFSLDVDTKGKHLTIGQNSNSFEVKMVEGAGAEKGIRVALDKKSVLPVGDLKAGYSAVPAEPGGPVSLGLDGNRTMTVSVEPGGQHIQIKVK